MPHSTPLPTLSYWRLGWLLAALLWALELRPTAVVPATVVGTYLRIGNSHPHTTPAAVLLEPSTLNREAIAPPGADMGSWLPLEAALLLGFSWQLTKPLTWLQQLRPCCMALSARLQQQQLLIAILPNAP